MLIFIFLPLIRPEPAVGTRQFAFKPLLQLIQFHGKLAKPVIVIIAIGHWACGCSACYHDYRVAGLTAYIYPLVLV